MNGVDDWTGSWAKGPDTDESDLLPEGARLLDDGELRAMETDGDYPDAAVEYQGTTFWLWDGLIQWKRADGKRPICFSPEQVQCMAVLADRAIDPGKLAFAKGKESARVEFLAEFARVLKCEPDEVCAIIDRMAT